MKRYYHKTQDTRRKTTNSHKISLASALLQEESEGKNRAFSRSRNRRTHKIDSNGKTGKPNWEQQLPRTGSVHSENAKSGWLVLKGLVHFNLQWTLQLTQQSSLTDKGPYWPYITGSTMKVRMIVQEREWKTKVQKKVGEGNRARKSKKASHHIFAYLFIYFYFT